MSRIHATALLTAVVLLCPAAIADAPRLESLLPTDSAVVVMVDDVPSLLASWPQSPLAQLWNDPQMKRFFAPLREDMEIDRWESAVQETVGYPLSEVLGAFTGQAAVVLLVDATIEDASEPPFEGAIIARFGEDRAIVEALMAADFEHDYGEEIEQGVRIEIVEQDFAGETLFVRTAIAEDGEQEERDVWAIVDGFALTGDSKALVEAIVSKLKGEAGEANLGDSSHFQAVRRRTASSDVLVYVNLEAFVPMVLESAKEQWATESGEQAQPNPLGITPIGVLDAFHLESLKAVFLSASLGRDATAVESGLLYDEGKGLVRLLEAYRPGPVSPPDWVPADVLDASAWNVSVPVVWNVVKEFAQGLSPAIDGLLQVQLQQLSTTAGFDLEKALFGSLGDRIVTANFTRAPAVPGGIPSTEDVDVVLALSVTDRQSLEMAIERLKGLAGPGVELFTPHDYLGHKIYTFVDPAPAAGEADRPAESLAYTLTDDYLLIGVGTSLGPLQAVLGQMRQPGRSVWQRPEVKTAFETFAPEASALAYSDVATYVKLALQGCTTMQALVEEDDTPLCDPEASPDPKLAKQYFSAAVGAWFREKGGVFNTVRLLHPRR